MGVAGIPFSRYDPQDWSSSLLQDWVHSQLGDWSKNVEGALKQAAEKQGLALSRDLVNSINSQVQKAAGDTLTHVFFAFEDYGRHADMKSLIYTKMPPIDEMVKFVTKVGLHNFRYVPGYEDSGNMPHETIAVKRIAWALSKGRLRKYKHRPKRWFARRFYGQINQLISTLLEGYQDAAVMQAKKEMAA